MLFRSIEASLKRLKTDWIDLYQVHKVDPLTPIEETLRALDDLVSSGKVRYIGSSNYAGWQVAEAELTSRMHHFVPFVSSQVEYSLLNRDVEAEHIPAITRYGQSLLPYYPLASGLLTGKYQRNASTPGTRLANDARYQAMFMTDANWTRIEKLTVFCQQRGRTLLELAFSWLAAQPIVACVIAGATRPEQLEANVKATDWALSTDELREIDRITKAV